MPEPPTSAQGWPAGRVAVIGHRGASADRPENTLAAFDEALRQGADGLELDIQPSRDGVPIVYHDRTLARAGWRGRCVGDLTAEELAGLDLDGERIATLDQVLARYGERTRLLIEIKARDQGAASPEFAHDVAGRIERAGATGHVMLLCFDPAVLALYARVAPRLPRVLNLAPPRRMSRALGSRLAALDALSVDVRTLTPAFAAAVREAGLPLLTYTCNTARRVERALHAGVQGVMSDRPGWLATYLASREGRGAA